MVEVKYSVCTHKHRTPRYVLSNAKAETNLLV